MLETHRWNLFTASLLLLLSITRTEAANLTEVIDNSGMSLLNLMASPFRCIKLLCASFMRDNIDVRGYRYNVRRYRSAPIHLKGCNDL
jgi:hypothetical protein